MSRNSRSEPPVSHTGSGKVTYNVRYEEAAVGEFILDSDNEEIEPQLDSFSARENPSYGMRNSLECIQPYQNYLTP